MEEDVQARRSWLSGLGVTLAAFVLGSRKALAQSAESPFRPARHPEDDWLEALPGKHRTFDAVVKELMANAIANSHFVPAGVVAVTRAQERGYTLLRA